MDAELQKRVIVFVAKETAVAPERVGLNTTLFGDLGVDGDDAWDLVEAFSKEFGADMRRFNHGRHFCGEGGGCFPPLALYFWLRGLRVGPHEAIGVEPVTVRDLVDAAECREWRK